MVQGAAHGCKQYQGKHAHPDLQWRPCCKCPAFKGKGGPDFASLAPHLASFLSTHHIEIHAFATFMGEGLKRCNLTEEDISPMPSLCVAAAC